MMFRFAELNVGIRMLKKLPKMEKMPFFFLGCLFTLQKKFLLPRPENGRTSLSKEDFS
jgi:hypothetical protein